MASPQVGIFVEGTSSHWFQEYDVSRSAGIGAIKLALAKLTAEVDGVQTVIGVGAHLAEQLGLDVPADLRPFETIEAGAFRAEATPHGLFVWMHGTSKGKVFDAALNARRTLSDVGVIVGDVPAFVYLDNRDLTGFIDGTENPTSDEGRQIAVIDDVQPGAGGSTVLVQRWVHDLDGFHSLEVTEQEQIIGRTKPDSVELEADALPDNAHIARVVMEDESGEEIEIYRRSVPWGDSTEAGLMFVGFSDELAKLDNMVRSMFGLPVGGEATETHDRIVEFSVAQSNNYFYCPSQEALASLG